MIAMAHDQWLDDGLRAMDSAEIVLVCSLRGPGGGRFLYALLDAHPQTICYPFKLNHLVHPREFEGRSKRQLIDVVLGRKRLFDTSLNGADFASLGRDGQQALVVDRATFSDSLSALVDQRPLTFRNFVLAVAIAHNIAIGSRPAGSHFIFYAHELHVAVRYLRALGAARILAAHRHPINLYASAMRYTRNWSIGSRWQESAALAGEAAAVAARRKKVLIPYRPGDFFLNVYKSLAQCGAVDVVLLERLHAEPEASLRLLAERLGLSWSPTLLEGTIHGLSWGGKGGARTGGFSRELHRAVRTDFVGRGGQRTIRFIAQNLHTQLGYQRTRAQWTDVLGIDRSALAYYRDVLTLLREIALDRDLGVSWQDGLRLCGRNIWNAACFPLVRLSDFFVAAASDRKLSDDKLRVVNPFVPGIAYFDSKEILR
jgi:hypothetical protein